MVHGITAHWSDLFTELWIDILSRLRENLDAIFVWSQRDCLKIFAQEHSNMHKLRLVCSKFNTALNDAQLSRCLFLRENFKTPDIPNFLRWAERQRASVHLFACNVGSPALEATLTALACTASQLCFAYLSKVSQAAVHILPFYPVLHSIDLGSGGVDTSFMGLHSLAELPSLGKLFLTQGRFQGMERLLHLTNLMLSDACLVCSAACIWASKLVKLRVYDSQLYFINRGLVACQNLRELRMRNCCVRASQIDDTISVVADAQALVPAGMSALKQLTLLDVTLCGDALEDIEFLRLRSLTTLQELCCCAQEEVELPAELTELTSLSELRLTTADSEDTTACMWFQVDWHAMRALLSYSLAQGCTPLIVSCCRL